MSLKKINENGYIKINNNVMGTIILEAMNLVYDRAFIASEKSKILVGIGGVKPSPGEVGNNIIFNLNENGKLYLEFYIITNFGVSIKNVSKEILDYIQEKITEAFPVAEGRILLRVVGVKSKNIAERNFEVEREWS